MSKKTLALIMMGFAMMGQAMAADYICMPKNKAMDTPACLGTECTMHNETPKEFEMICIQKTEQNMKRLEKQKNAKREQNLKVATIW